MNNFDDLLNNTPEAQKPQQPQLSNEEYAEKKQAERDSLYETADNAALSVANNGAEFQKYLDVQSRLSRHSANNALLLMVTKPEASQLGDFDFWKDKGGSIKANEKAISILERNEFTKDDNSVGYGYNVKKVFDISQVDTQKMKIDPPKNHDERQLLKALVHKAPMKIQGVDELSNGGGAMTDPQTGDIYVLKGMEFGDTFRTVAHEISLAEVDRDKVTDPQFTAYCASYILCNKNGIDTKGYDFNSVPHIFRDKEPKEIKGELSQIRNIAEDISGRMAKQLDAVQKAAKTQDSR
jgi:hypothetical protein